MYDLILTL